MASTRSLIGCDMHANFVIFTSLYESLWLGLTLDSVGVVNPLNFTFTNYRYFLVTFTGVNVSNLHTAQRY
ncbi:hypothetical protein D3C76_1576730 [compost metagenome]